MRDWIVDCRPWLEGVAGPEGKPVLAPRGEDVPVRADTEAEARQLALDFLAESGRPGWAALVARQLDPLDPRALGNSLNPRDRELAPLRAGAPDPGKVPPVPPETFAETRAVVEDAIVSDELGRDMR